jgi:CheY-like chemotaxis protein
MPIMDGLTATRLIRSFEGTGNWDAAVAAGIEQVPSSDSLQNGLDSMPSAKRMPIIAVSTYNFIHSQNWCYIILSFLGLSSLLIYIYIYI